MFVDLVLATPLRQQFTYQFPTELEGPFVGQRVLCPFGKQKQVVAIVVAIHEDKPDTKFSIKSVIEVVDSQPVLPANLWELLLWSAQYYLHPLGDALFSSLPIHFRQGRDCYIPTEQTLKLETDAPNIAANAKRQWQWVNALKEQDNQLTEAEIAALDLSRDALKRLLDLQIVSWHSQSKPDPIIQESDKPKQLAPAQQNAIDKINQNATSYYPLLLEGVTGSGKTEVFLQSIEQALKANRQVLILVPEISLTPQTLQRFAKRFKAKIGLLHSNLTDTQRFETWLQALHQQVDIIIGTRSAIFTPFADLGMIIVDEEHDGSFKQQEGYRYNARDLAYKRAQQLQIPLILASATPSLETLANVENGSLHREPLPDRITGELAKITLVNMKEQPAVCGISAPLQHAIKHHLSLNQQVLLFLNRRGYAPVLSCEECGWLSECRRCDAHMTWHKNPSHLHCHHCGSQRPLPRYCPQCLTGKLNPVGVGTEKAEDWLKQHFPDKHVIRVDRDTTSRKGGLDQLLNQIHSGEADIIIGTQMLAKGHHFAKLGLVGILDVDGAFFTADFRGPEKLMQLVTQVAGRAGREFANANVLLQTSYPDHPLFDIIRQHDYPQAAKWLLKERQETLLPPYYHQALIRCNCHNSSMAHDFLNQCKQLLQSTAVEAQIVGPLPAPIERKAGKYRYYLMIEAKTRAAIRACLQPQLAPIAKLPLANKVRWQIDVDPKELL